MIFFLLRPFDEKWFAGDGENREHAVREKHQEPEPTRTTALANPEQVYPSRFLPPSSPDFAYRKRLYQLWYVMIWYHLQRLDGELPLDGQRVNPAQEAAAPPDVGHVM